MSNIKTKNNFCGDGKHYHPNHHLADSTGCMKNSDMTELTSRENWRYKNQIKENFCPLCIAPLIAVIGVGATGAGALTKEQKDKKIREALVWTGVSILGTLAIWLIFIFWKKGCKECRLKTV